MTAVLDRILMKAAAIVSLVAMTACAADTVYYDYRHTLKAGWDKGDTLVFSVSPVRTAGRYHEVVCLRTTGAFPFTGVTLVVGQRSVPRNIVRSDVLKCTLTDRNGNVKGKGVSLYQYEFDLCDVDLNRGDSLNICIRHDMKREVLSGISDVGVKIVRTD